MMNDDDDDDDDDEYGPVQLRWYHGSAPNA
jgi:hypothetical protein